MKHHCIILLFLAACCAASAIGASSGSTHASEAFVIRPKVLGNVFTEGEPIEIPIETQAERLEYEVTDFFGKKVCAETADVTGGTAVLKPNVRARGHFAAKVRLVGGPGGEREIDFAVIEPVDLKNLQDSPFMAMTHFAQGWNTDMIPLIALAGIAAVRDEVYWAHVEKQKGVFDFAPFDGYMAELKRAGIHPLVPLTFENPLYDEGKTPYSPAGREAYARYAQEVLKHYGSEIGAVEVWNEYNGSWCTGPAASDRPAHYTEMCKTAYRRIKEIRPDVTVLGSAVVSIPLPYMEDVFKHGCLDDLDAVEIHPYRGRPEGVEQEIAALRALIRKYNHGAEKPIWATEFGYLDPRGPNAPRLLVRQSALMLSQNVRSMSWYLMRDYNEFKGMGLVHDGSDARGPYSPAPAYCAMAAMIRLLHDARFTAREAAAPYSRTYVLRFRKGSDDLRVCWATHPGRIRVTGAGAVTRVDLMGNRRSVKLNDGAAVLDVDETPFYLLGKAAGVTEVAGAETVLADSIEDYSTRAQGTNGWSYGYFDGSASASYTPDAFQPMHTVTTMWGETWVGPMEYLGASSDSLHPQTRNGKAVWAIKRWKSPVRGKIVVRGSFERDRQGDGCTVLILVDGKPVHDAHVGGPTSPTQSAFSLTLAVKPGTLIDFAVTPGPANNIDFDSTRIDAEVLQPAKVGKSLPTK